MNPKTLNPKNLNPKTLLYLLSHRLTIFTAGHRPQLSAMGLNSKPDCNGLFNPMLLAADQKNAGAANNIDVETWVSAGGEPFTSENIFNAHERPPELRDDMEESSPQWSS